jgi:hypothetical protein
MFFELSKNTPGGPTTDMVDVCAVATPKIVEDEPVGIEVFELSASPFLAQGACLPLLDPAGWIQPCRQIKAKCGAGEEAAEPCGHRPVAPKNNARHHDDRDDRVNDSEQPAMSTDPGLPLLFVDFLR